jgi:RsiW-degrading membrane proteinase PrsW (M82 family)
MILVWNILEMHAWFGMNTLYAFTESPNILLRVVGFILGVGVLEEVVKAIPLVVILHRAKAPYIPRSMVFYGLMSGIAFGVFEGIHYQMKVNVELDYSNAFFMNVARLTSLPFLHAIWAGMAGYFLAFAHLYPKYRLSLYFLAIAIPAVIHGLYDVFGWSIWGLILMFSSVILLMGYLKQSVNYRSKLSK